MSVPISINRTLIVLDPAHGGGDTGSRISDALTEKDVTLALAFRIRSLLIARGFSVNMTRDADSATSTPDKAATETSAAVPGAPLTLDDRAGIANHAHAAACLLIHATGSGSGVHLYSSELDPAPGEPAVAPWITAQAAWVPQSQRLADQIGIAFNRSHVPLVQSRASIRPVDSLTCPAVVLELAPSSSGTVSSLTDSSYLGRVAEAVTGALVFWQQQVQPPVRLLPPPPPAPAPTPVPVATSTGVQP